MGVKILKVFLWKKFKEMELFGMWHCMRLIRFPFYTIHICTTILEQSPFTHLQRDGGTMSIQKKGIKEWKSWSWNCNWKSRVLWHTFRDKWRLIHPWQELPMRIESEALGCAHLWQPSFTLLLPHFENPVKNLTSGTPFAHHGSDIYRAISYIFMGYAWKYPPPCL